jgi:transposase
LDNKVIVLEITQEEPVRNIVEQIREKWGQENSYRLIYAGKVIKEGNLLVEYGVTGTLPIIVLVTKPINTERKEASQKSSKYANIKPEDNDAALKKKSRQYVLSRKTEANFTGSNTNYIITDTDFSSSLNLIMSCNYLFQEDVGKITKEEMIIAVNIRFQDDDPEEAPVKEMIIEKLEEVLSAGPNEAQFNAFLTLGYCWCQTYQPQRDQ